MVSALDTLVRAALATLAPAAVSTRVRVAALTLVPAVALTQVRAAVFTPDPVAVRTLVRAVASTPVPVVALTRVRAAVRTLVPAVGLTLAPVADATAVRVATAATRGIVLIPIAGNAHDIELRTAAIVPSFSFLAIDLRITACSGQPGWMARGASNRWRNTICQAGFSSSFTPSGWNASYVVASLTLVQNMQQASSI